MAIKNLAATSILGLLFVSLAVIYLVLPTNALVTFLCVLIMAVSLAIAVIGGWWELGVMALFSAFVSVVAAYFVGEARFGGIGSVVVPVVWLVMLWGVFRWISRNRLIVQEDRAILLANTYTGTIQIVPPPLAPPPLPQIQRIAAVIPKYELVQDVHIKQINTESGHNIDAIHVHVVYKVSDPLKTLSISERGGLPNRGQVQIKLAKDMGMDLHVARAEITFWEKLLDLQMQQVLEDIVRDVIYHHAPNPVEAYRHREPLAHDTHQQLSEQVQHWGMTIAVLEFDHIDVDRERFKAANMESTIERETRMKEIEAKREATRITLMREAAATAEAQRVTKLIQAIKESGVELSPDDLEDIVLSAIRASSDGGLEGEYWRLASEAAPVATSSEKKDHGAKK